MRQTSRVCQSFTNILFFKIWEVGQQIGYAAPGSDSFHDHADRDAHATYAWLAAHHCRIDRNAPEFLHAAIIAQAQPAPRMWDRPWPPL